MDALKKFLKKKKADKNFKTAGPGQKLNDPASVPRPSASGGSGGSRQHPPQQRSGPTDEKRRAAAAALERLEKSRPQKTSDMLQSRQIAYIREQAKKEIEAENQRNREYAETGVNKSEEEHHYTMRGQTGEVVNQENLAVSGVYFTCPIIGPEILPRKEIDDRIRVFLDSQPVEEVAVTSCLIIHSCNKGRDKINACVEILCKYLDNIIQHPEEVKYRKIKMSNKVFQEKVVPMNGTAEFLTAVGFTKEKVGEEEFWVFTPKNEEFVSSLTELRDTLQSTTPIRPELDRNLQVLMPTQVVNRRELPEDFYNVTLEELKKEQKRKTEFVERETTLRTKATRERDEMREQRFYKYAIIRIRFPDGLFLQGTFHSYEKIGDIYEFVQENLSDDNLVFYLRVVAGDELSNMDATLAEYKLPPATIINFILENPPANPGEITYLKSDILALIQGMS